MTPSSWILFADLDGTVLDRESYAPGPSLHALERCRRSGIEVIFSSSKTRAEMERVLEGLGAGGRAPFVTENGGGIFFPRDAWRRPADAEPAGAFWKVTLGAAHGELLRVLDDLAARLGLRIRCFSRESPEGVARVTGLPVEEARLARAREFDEPFWLEEEDPAALEALRKAASEAGLVVTRGGRFFHLHGATDKGKSLRRVRAEYKKTRGTVKAAAVGDAANDLPMLLAADRAYLVKGHDGIHDPDVPERGDIRFLDGVGPEGFSQAVDDLLGDEEG